MHDPAISNGAVFLSVIRGSCAQKSTGIDCVEPSEAQCDDPHRVAHVLRGLLSFLGISNATHETIHLKTKYYTAQVTCVNATTVLTFDSQDIRFDGIDLFNMQALVVFVDVPKDEHRRVLHQIETLAQNAQHLSTRVLCTKTLAYGEDMLGEQCREEDRLWCVDHSFEYLEFVADDANIEENHSPGFTNLCTVTKETQYTEFEAARKRLEAFQCTSLLNGSNMQASPMCLDALYSRIYECLLCTSWSCVNYSTEDHSSKEMPVNVPVARANPGLKSCVTMPTKREKNFLPLILIDINDEKPSMTMNDMENVLHRLFLCEVQHGDPSTLGPVLGFTLSNKYFTTMIYPTIVHCTKISTFAVDEFQTDWISFQECYLTCTPTSLQEKECSYSRQTNSTPSALFFVSVAHTHAEDAKLARVVASILEVVTNLHHGSTPDTIALLSISSESACTGYEPDELLAIELPNEQRLIERVQLQKQLIPPTVPLEIPLYVSTVASLLDCAPWPFLSETSTKDKRNMCMQGRVGCVENDDDGTSLQPQRTEILWIYATVADFGAIVQLIASVADTTCDALSIHTIPREGDDDDDDESIHRKVDGADPLCGVRVVMDGSHCRVYYLIPYTSFPIPLLTRHCQLILYSCDTSLCTTRLNACRIEKKHTLSYPQSLFVDLNDDLAQIRVMQIDSRNEKLNKESHRCTSTEHVTSDGFSYLKKVILSGNDFFRPRNKIENIEQMDESKLGSSSNRRVTGCALPHGWYMNPVTGISQPRSHNSSICSEGEEKDRVTKSRFGTHDDENEEAVSQLIEEMRWMRSHGHSLPDSERKARAEDLALRFGEYMGEGE